MLISIEQTCFRTSLLRANKDLFKRSISLSSVDSREGVIRVGLHIPTTLRTRGSPEFGVFIDPNQSKPVAFQESSIEQS